METVLDELRKNGTFYAAILSGLLALAYFRRRSGDPYPTDRPTKAGEPVDPALGEWQPRKFAYPKIAPHSKSFTEIKEIPYRPFRPGAYHVNMGLRNMPWDDWIELDNRYERYHAIRKYRVQSRGDKLIRVLTDDHNPQVRGGALAAIELVHELAEYLVARYPQDFSIARHGQGVISGIGGYCDWGWEGAPPIKSITVGVVGETYDLPLHIADGERAPERALEVASLLVQDDLALMIEGKDGKYYFQAGSILVPGFWRIQDKIGLPLDEIHTSADVPQYREKLQVSMDRFFRRLQVDKPVSRNNYFLQVVRSAENGGDELKAVDPEDLAWSPVNGPEDSFALAHAFDNGQEAPTVDQLWFRTERQTLRRLPISGAILFTIRTYQVPIVRLAEEKGVPERLGSALRGWTEDVKDYKGVYRGGWWDTLLEFLDDKKGQEEGHEA